MAALSESLGELFARTVRTHAAATAVECGGERITYAELDALANRWARWMLRRGVARGSRVAFQLPRSIEAHALLLAILKSGAAYVPLDPEFPPERVRQIVDDCGAALLIAADARLPGAVAIDVLRAEGAAESSAAPDVAAAGDDEAYVIYTSGSTGRPKGMSISHRSVCHLVRVEGELFGVRPDDRVFQGFSLAFDASVEEIWLAYFAGATLVVGPAEMVRSGPDLAARLDEAGVTVLSCVPTLLSMMDREARGVRLLIVGGEACPQPLVDRWARDGRRMWNTYGPTEATVIATCGECRPGRPVTIGRPLPGYRAVIVDERMQPLLAGQAGELLLGGVGLSRGYVGLPELTREKFVPDPWAGDGPLEGNGAARLYRTGDLCRFNADGEIEFLGRIDSQVKLRGYRIELSEIEAVLLQHPGVRSAAVTVREDVPSVKHLVAYVVPQAGSPAGGFEGAGSEALESELRSFVRERLPPYMIPALIEFPDELPTLSSGKIDRRRLPAPHPRAAPTTDSEPTGLAEREVLEVWRRMFAPAPVALSDDFFLDRGGDSLTAAGMISELRRQPRFRAASMRDIYDRPVLRDFAAGFDRFEEAVTSTGPERGGRASSLKFALCGAAQLPCLFLVLGLSGLQWLSPFLAYSWLQDSEWSVGESVAGAVAALVLIYPALILLAVAGKWLCLGRVRAGSYPLWGWFYLRWWFVQALESVVPLNYLIGTPLLNLYCRLMGARIGPGVHLGSDDIGAYDLLDIGEGASVGADSSLLGYRVADGRLTIGPISVGRDCFLGVRSFLETGVRMEDGARLDDLSLLPQGTVIPRGETWRGSPAMRSAEPAGSTPPRGDTRARRFWFALGQLPGVLLVPVVVVGAILPGMAAMHHLNDADDYYWYLLLSPAVGLSFVVLLALQILIVKRLLLGSGRTGTFPLYGGFALRKWHLDLLLDLSLDILGTLYSTLYLAPWYRALGAKLGRGSEVSTASFISPDLLELDEGAFIADAASLGAARVENGKITVDRVRVGRRSFVGNSALLPPGTRLEDDTLIGCLSLPPAPQGRPVPEGTSWVGSPAVRLPRRSVNRSFAAETTFTPPPRLVALRLFIEFWRVALPPAGYLCVASLMFSALAVLRDEIEEWQAWLAFPFLYVAACLLAALTLVVVKWTLMGRYRPRERPLWSGFVWRTELVTGLHDYLVGPLVLESLRGTPFLAWYFRLMGARVGRRVYCDTLQITEFDLVTVGDDACLDSDVTLQTHLFEDRVMKMSHVRIGPECAAGAESLILYDTEMQRGARLGSLSLLMKGETLPEGTCWEGTPARCTSTPGRT